MASKEFVNEIEILARLDHQNIVRLVGFVEDLKRDKAWIVLSWAPNGNVRQFLARGKWEIPERISLIQDMFKGLEYLHSRKPPIRHGDLKSDNILVSSSYRTIITDFGSARSLGDADHRIADQDAHEVAEGIRTTARHPSRMCPLAGSEVMIVASDTQLTLTGPAWSLRWAAPEIINGEDNGGLSSDIWSAGWVCWEIMTNKIPFSELESEVAITLEIVQETGRLTPQHAELRHVIRLYSLMMDCWKFEPKARPEANHCCDTVKWMPSIAPLGHTPARAKASSTALLVNRASIYCHQSDYKNASSLFRKAMATAGVSDNKGRADALRGLGEVDYLQSKFTNAEEFYAQARDIYMRIGDDLGQAHTSRGLGDVYRVQSKYLEAERFYAQAVAISHRICDYQGQAHTLLGLGDVYLNQSKYPKAKGFYTQARVIYKAVGDDLGQAHTSRGLGDVCLLQCKFPEAKAFYTQARDICVRLGNDQGRAQTLRGLGHVYFVQSKYPEAKESYIQARDIYVRIGDDRGQAHTLRELGDVYRVQFKYLEAEGFYAYARDIYGRIGDGQGQAHTLHGLGDVYRVQSKYIEAEGIYAQALTIYRRIGDAQGRAHTLCGLGHVYRLQSKFSEAKEFYAQAGKIYIRISDHLGRANTLRGLGHLYRCQKRNSEAAVLFAKARKLYFQVGNRRDEENASYWLAIVSEVQGFSTASRLQSADTPVPSD